MKEKRNNCWNLQCFGYTSEYVVKVKWRQLQLRKDLWIQFGNLKEYGKYVDELQNNMNKLLTTTIPNWTEAKGHVYDNTMLNNKNKIKNECIFSADAWRVKDAIMDPTKSRDLQINFLKFCLNMN